MLRINQWQLDTGYVCKSHIWIPLYDPLWEKINFEPKGSPIANLGIWAVRDGSECRSDMKDYMSMLVVFFNICILEA